MKKDKNLKRFLKFIISKNKLKLSISFFLVIVSSCMSLYLPKITRKIVDEGIMAKDYKFLLNLIIIYLIIVFSSAIIDIILEYLYNVMKNKVTSSFKIKLFHHLSKLSGQYFSNIKSGNIFSIVEQDLYIVEGFNAELLFSIIMNFITAICSVYFLFMMSKDMLFIVVILQILLILSQSKIRKLISKMTREIRNLDGNLANISQEYISNIMNVVISKSKKIFLKRYIKQMKSIIEKNMIINLIMVSNISISKILSGMISATIYGYGGYKIISGKLSIGELIAFQQYTGMLVNPCINIIRSANKIEQVKVSIDRIYSIIDEPIEIFSPLKSNIFGSNLEHKPIENIEFKNVYFKYSDKDNQVLNGVNLSFSKGKTTAIVGGSGCGKSTISNLIYRLWDVSEGEITINGINIKNVNLAFLRKNINVVTQDVLIFDNTIRDNISLGKNIEDEEILSICNIVGMKDFIESLEDGLYSIVGEKGVKMSGGQKQRIAMARALAGNSDILVFDESTSSLDNISQKEIMKNMKEVIKDKIVIIIAHRLSTIKDADNIYVIKDGQVAESGSDEELIILGGDYSLQCSGGDVH
ncbi:ABC transporter ATP-binding protein [Clostridioides difficile]|uniref:ABC transporter ATP-binding protein n=1 Tax=Clostridioides difficile TaxID=1496 RepID=UPI00097FFF08|nr:ABC transporter ATP-binding protein [Clostridioides difficile]EKJ1396758.1 ABC transporter ATP-binding protein [Clostridioides difficile]SJT05442.1 Putative multidrug export ATP-binding/permease protein SAV1866 [Clostridioides difficile]SJT10322.1 Putative multidrug export ATP-binding/permease protein SAV1866 [Clostridioides difficile]SJT56842.1 Putative multidrug export ATP-binding/permease protein SAV1866 [Clostridioides difficile]HBF6273267.1 ABC transporter ATP-binding protein [Clostrid